MKGDSALTRFVKNLLGLDQLDALIEGLDDAKLKGALTEYRSALGEGVSLESRRYDTSVERDQLRQAVNEVHVGIDEVGRALHISEDRLRSVPHLQEVAPSPVDQTALQTIAQLTREARKQWESIRTYASGAAVAATELSSAEASTALNLWIETGQAKITQALLSVRLLVANQPDVAVVGPRRVIEQAIASLEQERSRITNFVNKDADDTSLLTTLDEQLRRAAARLMGG